jgi:hypothetical protein
METSLFIARMLAVYYLAVGFGFLLNGKYYREELSKLLDSSGFRFFGGIMAFVIGALIIQYHNFWVKDWTVLVTIIGWLSLTKGLFLIIFPTSFGFIKPMLKPKNLTRFMTPMIFIMGLVFGYFGFIA